MVDLNLDMTTACRVRYAPVVEIIQQLLQIDDDEPLLIAIDGDAASGKTTLGYYLQEIFSCNLFHMDDFFLQMHQRTEERLHEIGGNIDYERFYAEVIKPLCNKQTVVYRPYSCLSRRIVDERAISYQRLNIIEGSYSQHPYFKECYRLKVFIEISPQLQEERILQRNGESMLQRFQQEWIPKEKAYFDKFAIRENSILISW